MPVARLRPISRHIAAVDLHDQFQVAVFFVRHAEGLALVDAGFPGWQYAILTAAESLPRPNRITHILLTHAHADHIGGAAEIAKHTGAVILSSAIEQPFIEGRSLARTARGVVSAIALQLNQWFVRRRVPKTRVGGTLEEGARVCGLRVLSVPGHTPGQIALAHDEDGVLLCADAFFNIDGRPGHDPVPGMTWDAGVARESLERIASLGFRDIVPSHGPALIGDGPEQLRRFLESAR
jgi:glyoxylase-like metal-dependent hydrolase (beta-lactamase superfamily II)